MNDLEEQKQTNDIASLPFSEQVRLIISEQFINMRCLAKKSEKEGNYVDCELPNALLRLLSGDKKRIKKKVINVPIGVLNGAELKIPDSGFHGMLMISNFHTDDIESAMQADLSCVNIVGNKCLFIPAMYENEFADEYNLKAKDKITLGSNGTGPKGVAREGDEVTIDLNQNGAQEVVTAVSGGSGSPAVGTYSPISLKGTITSSSKFVFATKDKPS